MGHLATAFAYRRRPGRWYCAEHRPRDYEATPMARSVPTSNSELPTECAVTVQRRRNGLRCFTIELRENGNRCADLRAKADWVVARISPFWTPSYATLGFQTVPSYRRCAMFILPSGLPFLFLLCFDLCRACPRLCRSQRLKRSDLTGTNMEVIVSISKRKAGRNPPSAFITEKRLFYTALTTRPSKLPELVSIIRQSRKNAGFYDSPNKRRQQTPSSWRLFLSREAFGCRLLAQRLCENLTDAMIPLAEIADDEGVSLKGAVAKQDALFAGNALHDWVDETILFARSMCSYRCAGTARAGGSRRHPGSDRPAGISIPSPLLKLYI